MATPTADCYPLTYLLKLLLLFSEQNDGVLMTKTLSLSFACSNIFGSMLQVCWLWTMIRSCRLPRTLEAAVFLRHFYVRVQQQSENLKFSQSKPFLNSSTLWRSFPSFRKILCSDRLNQHICFPPSSIILQRMCFMLL